MTTSHTSPLYAHHRRLHADNPAAYHARPAFAPLDEMAGQLLAWRERGPGVYELAGVGGQRAALLRFEPAPAALPGAPALRYATLESAGGVWRVRSGGVARQQAALRRQGDRVDLLCFSEDSWNGGGALSFPDGPAFTAHANCWLHTYQISGADGEPLLIYRSRPGAAAGSLEIKPAAAGLAELPYLALFGWQLFLSLYQDARTQRHLAA